MPTYIALIYTVPDVSPSLFLILLFVLPLNLSSISFSYLSLLSIFLLNNTWPHLFISLLQGFSECNCPSLCALGSICRGRRHNHILPQLMMTGTQTLFLCISVHPILEAFFTNTSAFSVLNDYLKLIPYSILYTAVYKFQ